ncbi:MAG: divergent polysaccharide deacetylase family protein [Candidatus Cloacimonetes bacterium]|nr:divergent polysaccharide deacetylase family protein [Candidatus Cloacimonadota bacterium]MCB5287102.1 divergent polysaccharide deacetylase family protein [Candidatus Cloacimonadota bacterium]MCK9184416.1 divergent polysaccharide deacetylase family protein [Candidatus Cloacimonadota bacterium]MDY0229423.1 divergent polysaccharide deacetylase family protein [Candidatus Cloacimonadaceae bacterium]
MANLKKLIFPLVILLALFACTGKPEAEDPAEQSQSYEDTYEESPEQPEPQETQEAKPTALQSYKYTWSKSDEMPDVVIIIDDFGNSAGQLLDDFGDLPSEYVFAIMPDLAHTKAAADLATRKGHEVIIHVPMEAENSKISPGEKFISKNMEEEQIKAVLDDFIKQLPMAIAANNHMGSATTANLQTMNKVIGHLKKKGLYFIDSVTSSQTAVYTAGVEQGVFTAKRDIFLDVPDVSEKTLAKKIQDLGKFKGRKEPVIIITHCHNREKLVALQKFVTQIKAMGINIVPLRDAFTKTVS